MAEDKKTPGVECESIHRDGTGLGCTHDGGQDAWLVERTRRGDERAFEELVRRYERRLIKTLYHLVGDLEVARDITQETFLRFYQSLERFDASRRVGPWLFRIAVNLATDWRRRGRHLSASTRAQRHGVEPNHRIEYPETDDRALAEEVRHVLSQIPEPYRMVLVLRELEGMPTSEIAAITGRKEATIRWRVAQARHMFRELWEARLNGRSQSK